VRLKGGDKGEREKIKRKGEEEPLCTTAHKSQLTGYPV